MTSSPFDKDMDIIVDTREHPDAIKWILMYFRSNGIRDIHKKLDVGDYCVPQNPHLVIDRKRTLLELSENLGSGNGRFMREIRRAHDRKIKLIILCECGNGIKSIEDVATWKNPMLEKYKNAMTGHDLAENMYRVHIAYGVEFMFCDRDETGRRIIEILRGGLTNET